MRPVEEEGLNKTLEVCSRAINVGRSSARIQHAVFFQDALVAVGHSTIVNVGHDGKAAALGDVFLAKIKELQGELPPPQPKM